MQEPEVDSTTEDTPLDDAVQKDYEQNVVRAVKPLFLDLDASTSGDAPFPKLELDDTTSTFVDGPLADEAKEAVLDDEHQECKCLTVLETGRLVGPGNNTWKMHSTPSEQTFDWVYQPWQTEEFPQML